MVKADVHRSGMSTIRLEARILTCSRDKLSLLRVRESGRNGRICQDGQTSRLSSSWPTQLRGVAYRYGREAGQCMNCLVHNDRALIHLTFSIWEWIKAAHLLYVMDELDMAFYSISSFLFWPFATLQQGEEFRLEPLLVLIPASVSTKSRTRTSQDGKSA